MSKCKRILAFVLLAVMLLSLLPTFAMATATTTEGLTNLVTGNGGFESGFVVELNGDGQTWNGSGSNPKKAEIATDVYRSGAQSAKLGALLGNTYGAGNKWLSVTLNSENIGLVLGHTYRVIVYSKQGSADSYPRLGYKLNGEGSTHYYDAGEADSNGWAMHQMDLTVTEDTDSFVIYLANYVGKDYPNNYCYFDDFAIYDLDEEFHTVTWKNADGTVLNTEKVTAGTTPEYDGTPEWAGAGKYAFEFAGWNPAVTAVTGDVTYTAQYIRTENQAKNGGFEEDKTWNTSGGDYSTEKALTGERSIKIDNDGSKSQPWVSQTFTPVAGHTYRITVRYYGEFAVGDQPQIRIRPRYLNEGTGKNEFISGVTKAVDPTIVQSGDQWGTITYDYAMPNNTADCIVYLRLSGEELVSHCYFDDFTIYDVTDETVNTEIYGSNIGLGNDLTMNFYFDKKNAAGTGCYAMVNSERVELDQFDTTGNYYKIPFAGLNAKEMNDVLTVTVYDAAGEAISAPFTDSVRSYCLRNIGKSAAELNIDEGKLPAFRTLVVDMLNYGAAAQTYKSYKTDNLANAGLTAAQKAYGTQENPNCTNNRNVDPDGIYYGTSFNMENSLSMNLYVLTSAIEDGYAIIKKGGQTIQTIQASDASVSGNYTRFTVDQFVAKDGREQITCEFYDKDNQLVVTVADSLESYVARMGKENPWLYEVMKYSDAAKAYLV